MQRNTFSNEKQWISGPLDKRSTTLVELGIDGTVQNPKKRRTFALEISDEYDKTASSGYRRPANPSEGGLRMLSGA